MTLPYSPRLNPEITSNTRSAKSDFLSIMKQTKPLDIFLVTVAFLIVHAFVLAANPFKAETVAPVALYQDYSGWAQHAFNSPPTHPERSDALDVFLPQWLTLKQALRSGESGLWNPLTGLGHVGLPELTRGTLTPSFLFFAAIEPDWLAYYVSGLVKLVLASLGVYLLMARFLGTPAAAFGGVVYALCGFNAAWFYWPQVSTAAWIPWLLWASVGWFQTRQPRWLPLGSLITSLLMVGGFPTVSVYGLYATALMIPFLAAATWTSARPALFTCVLWGGALLAGFLLVAIPLLATLDMLSYTDLSYRGGGSPYRLPQDLPLLLSPYFGGEPRVEKTLYTGIVALALACLAILKSGIGSIKRPSAWWFSLYAISLLLLALSMVFAVFPHEWMLAIPAVGTSPWSRFSVLVGLSIAILAAFGFDCIWRVAGKLKTIRLKLAARAMLICIALLQLLDQRTLFQNFNTVAKAGDFSPPTPTLDFVAENLDGFQSVVADSSYLIGGTLGTYGVAEWFAHGFKTSAEKSLLTQLVRDPFRSPTAAMFPGESIRLDDDLYARLGIRYVLTDTYQLSVIRSQSLGGHEPLPPLPDNTLSQVIRFDEAVQIDAIGLVLATYGKPYAPGNVRLGVLDGTGREVASSILSAKAVRDNRNAIFSFQDSLYLSPGKYEFQITLTENLSSNGLTAWYTTEPNNLGDEVKVNGRPSSGSMIYSLYAGNAATDGWVRSNIPGELVQIYENLGTPKGPYFVERLDSRAEWVDAEITYQRVKPEVLRIEYETSTEGYIVIPMRLYPGWRAYVNGRVVPHTSYLGVMPAIPVSPGAPRTIVYKFEPAWLQKGGALMALGFVFLFVMYVPAVKWRSHYSLQSD